MGGRTRKLRNKARRQGLVQSNRFDSGSTPGTAAPVPQAVAPWKLAENLAKVEKNKKKVKKDK